MFDPDYTAVAGSKKELPAGRALDMKVGNLEDLARSHACFP
jgi:hypothetical protein